uniref:equilibrative nucleoside transporter 4 isoform X1 n=2 Tax=Myxine glutinosa TaxID=7769 RepID=UPI00358DF277
MKSLRTTLTLLDTDETAGRWSEMETRQVGEDEEVVRSDGRGDDVHDCDEERGGPRNGSPSSCDSIAYIQPSPSDDHHGIYFSMLLAGVGFLLPYNSFVTDVDFLHHRFPGTSVVLDLSITYVGTALAASLINNAFVELLSLHTRITAGYILVLLTLLLVSVFDLALELVPPQFQYHVTLLAIALCAFGCTVQQSSFYGYVSLLPPRYTQAIMTGESTAGVIVSMSRIVTKTVVKDERQNTLAFFLISTVLEATCCCLHQITRRSAFVRHHLLNQEWLPTPPMASRPSGGGPQYLAHHDVAAEEVRFECWDVVPVTSTTSYCLLSTLGHGRRNLHTLAAMVRTRCSVIRSLWPLGLTLSLTCLVTLSLFPGVTSEIRGCAPADWLPITLMAIFNLSDLVGKILAAGPRPNGPACLLTSSAARLVLIPLFLLCVLPRSDPTLSHPAWPCTFSSLLGLTNGYLSSVPMIQAPTRVSSSQRELAGNIMTVSYMAGLAAGSAFGYCTFSFTRSAPPSCFPTENGTFTRNTF